MDKVLTSKNFIKSLPGVIPLAIAFLLPLSWWPTEKTAVALLLYIPLMALLVYVGCKFSHLAVAVKSEGSPSQQQAFTGAGLLVGLFVGFVSFVVLYRAFCL